MSFKAFVVRAALGLMVALPLRLAIAETIPPFGADFKPGPDKVTALASAKAQAVDCFSPETAGLWMVELPAAENPKPFSIVTDHNERALHIQADQLMPAHSTVRILLPGDGPANGDVWAKNKASYVAFLCKSNKPADLTFHLLLRGKTSGTYQTGFSAAPGEWQQVILPIAQFNLKSMAKIAGLGIRVADAEKDTVVSIAHVMVGAMPFSDDSWKGRRVSISLKGDWHFSPAIGEQGIAEKWFAPEFDDSNWKTLKSGLSWQEQGFDHKGFGWYRQKIIVPKEMAGVPLTITLCKMPSDDDGYFNGVRVGGWRGEYKYDNQMVRTYTIPPALIRYGEPNTIAIRIWGGNLGFIGDKSGLVAGLLTADLDPYSVRFRDVGGSEMAAELYDLSAARQGKPFEIVFPFPADVAKEQGTQLRYRLTDFNGGEIRSGVVPLVGGDGVVRAVVAIDRDTAQTVYLRGRLAATLVVEDAAGNPVYSGTRKLDRLCFTQRDETALPALPEKIEATPYGQLKLIDEIDASTSLFDDPHPYLQSGFVHSQDRVTPGSDFSTRVIEILGRKARESDFGWFGYRLGRGKLKPHSMYLVRIEYPEDKPRYCPIEIQTGQNFTDNGWKNGVSADDPYDNWPLSGKWQWYDCIVPLDDESVGAGGTGSASAENGLWVYFMNKNKPRAYNAMFAGGPAVGRIRLYEIDVDQNAPIIHRPAGLPQRVLSFDWERQADHEPADFVRYAKLMGYSAISPIMLKWGNANYSEPLNGYMTVNIDDHSYWTWDHRDPKAGEPAAAPIPGKPSEHVRYLEATKKYGVNYIPRFEYGGSAELPKEAWALGIDGAPMKPNRFAAWGANLLNPLTWDDLQKWMDHLIKPYAADNPQMTGALWRIRCNRMSISYGKADIELFSKETGNKLPPGGDAQAAAWAAGKMKEQYDDWWQQKRAAFHIKLAQLLQSYRPDMTLYYYNWDEDKFALIKNDLNAWGFLQTLGTDGRAAYEKDRQLRKTFTGADYVDVMKTGNFGETSKGINRADYAVRPDLYKNAKGIQIFGPANTLCYIDSPEYLNYFQTADGLAISNLVSYDEIASRSINPKYEGNMVTPAGGAFSMVVELMSYFHSDARTLNYTVYTYGRGFADAHRRFAQAFLALPAIPATVVEQGDKDLKIRTYAAPSGQYVGVAYKGYAGKTLTIRVPAKAGATVKNLVTDQPVPATLVDGQLQFNLESGPMELNAFLVQ